MKHPLSISREQNPQGDGRRITDRTVYAVSASGTASGGGPRRCEPWTTPARLLNEPDRRVEIVLRPPTFRQPMPPAGSGAWPRADMSARASMTNTRDTLYRTEVRDRLQGLTHMRAARPEALGGHFPEARRGDRGEK